MNKDVWIVDAANITDKSSFDEELLYRTGDISQFLETDSKQFVAAPKGFGKTFVLKAKSIFLRKNKSAKFIPENELVDKFSTRNLPLLSNNDVGYFSKTKNMAQLWSASIVCAVLIKMEIYKSGPLSNQIERDPHLSSIFTSGQKTVQDFFSRFINNRSLFEKITRTYLTDYLNPALKEVSGAVYIFIDNVDEFFLEHLENDQEYSSTYNDELWYQSQYCLLTVGRELSQECRHIKLFSTIRREVFDRISSTMRGQYSDSICYLEYSKKDLLEIFTKNILNEDESNLADSNAEDPIVAFFGVGTIYNTHVGTTEEIFDYLLRHTLQRPRELIQIGREISRINANDRIEKTIKNRVNTQSCEIGRQYLSEISLHFKDAYFNDMFSLINKNVLSREELENTCIDYNTIHGISYDEETASACPRNQIYCILYSHGLIGYQETNLTSGEVLQRFRHVDSSQLTIQKQLPQADNYFIHPCLNDLIRELNPDFEPSRALVISADEKLHQVKEFCDTEATNKINNIHVHFGLGQLGIGLVIEKFKNSEKTLVLVQRPTGLFKKLKLNSEIDIYINGLKLVTTKVAKNSFKIDKIKKGQHILLISDNKTLISYILGKATSISTALGQSLSNILPYFSEITYSKKNLYAFENSKDDIQKLHDSLQTRNPKISVIPVIADRICFNREVLIDQSLIRVSTETYQNSYIKKVNEQVTNDLKQTSELHIVDEEEFLFFFKRKFYIVNGIHMILAIYAYTYCRDRSIPLHDCSETTFKIFLDAIKESKEKYDSYVKLQGIRIIIGTSEDLLGKLFPNKNKKEISDELVAYADNTWERLRESNDKLGRILSIENLSTLQKKYIERVLPLVNFITASNRNDLLSILEEDNLNSAIRNLLDLNASLVQILFDLKQ
ncbi:MAG: hypothetical protein AB2803_14290 [Candidatus Thiodiazotropha sp.]